MSDEFYAIVHELTAQGRPFAIATIVQTDGSASARAGSKAIIHPDGTTRLGWVGGGCVESLVAREAQESLRDGKTRLIPVDLHDEVTGAGMPCGGHMTVYIEPVVPRPHIQIVGHGRIAETVARIGLAVGFRVSVNGPGAAPDRYPGVDDLVADDPDFRKLALTPSSYVVVTTQHKADDQAIKGALARGAKYIALVASMKRTGIILGYLAEDGVRPEQLTAIRGPAGLDLGCVTPEEIALSIVAEIVAVHRGGSGRPLREVKGAAQPGGPESLPSCSRAV